jgi:Fimbrial assembly protein (PilN)
MKPVNLVPQDQRRRVPSEGSGKGAQAVLGVLAVLLAMVVAYVLTANTVTERQNETEEARLEADRLEAQAVKKDDVSDFTAIAETRVQSVAAVAATRFDWERLMRELSRVMPPGTWLQSASASATGAVEGAGAAAAGAAPAPAPGAAASGSPTANLVGCTSGHSGVAQLMVRLRQLHRVTDVALTQSSKEDATAAAGLEGCGGGGSFDLTLTFSPTAPIGDAPRGATQVPASLGGGS